MSSTISNRIIAAFLWAVALIPVASVAQAPIPVGEAFRLGVSRDAEQGLRLDWTIKPGHYLYREKIAVRTADGQTLLVTTDAGERKDDPIFGPTEIYRDKAQAGISRADLPGSATSVDVVYQGCAEKGVCYPPVTKTIDLATSAVRESVEVDAGRGASTSLWAQAPKASTPAVTREAKTSGANPALTGSLTAMLASFLGFGLLLALTPCVFPMVPILSGMLARSGGTLTARRGFALSSSYVLAMALAYAALGAAAAWSGQNLQAALQTPLALGLMSLIFVGLAASMFGFYELQLPASWTTRLTGASTGRGGSIAGAALLGFGSALIVGPCVTPPLAAALLYVAQTGDLARGAGALFALGLGMGLPLIVFGTFGSGLLPRSGPWLVKVKQAFGFVFIGLAISMISRVIPETTALALWAALAIGTAVFIGALDQISQASGGIIRAGKAAGFALLVYGVALLIGFAGGASDPLRPLAFIGGAAQQAAALDIRSVTSSAAFDAAVAGAQAAGQPVLVAFSADWCVTCKTNERTLFLDPNTQARLQRLTVIKADVTANDGDSRDLMARFAVAGPPTMFLLDAKSGREIGSDRMIGAISLDDFNRALDRAGA